MKQITKQKILDYLYLYYEQSLFFKLVYATKVTSKYKNNKENE